MVLALEYTIDQYHLIHIIKKNLIGKSQISKNSSLIGDQTVSLPLSPNLTNKNIDRILSTIEKSFKKLVMKKILITGGTGLLGQEMVKGFLKKKCVVYFTSTSKKTAIIFLKLYIKVKKKIVYL